MILLSIFLIIFLCIVSLAVTVSPIISLIFIIKTCKTATEIKRIQEQMLEQGVEQKINTFYKIK